MTASKQRLGADFRALLHGSIVTNMGDGIRLAALPLLALTLTSSPLLIASVTAAQYLPWLVFAPFGGVIVDRWDRRRIILATQTSRGLVIAGLTALVVLDVAAIWQLCIVAFVITAGEILVDPSVVALVPTVVDNDDLDTANGRIASAEIITNDFAGGPIGAAAFVWTPWLPFAIDAVSYLGSTVPFSKLPKVTTGPHARTRPTGDETRAGFDFLRSHPVLGPFTLAQVVYYVGVSVHLSLLVLLVDLRDDSAVSFGIILAAGAIGAFVGSLVGGRLAAILGPRSTLAGSVALQGLALIAMAAAPSAWQLAIIWLIAGVPTGVQRPVARSLQQRLTPNELLGRVNIAGRVFTRGVIIIGALTGGTVAGAFGAPSAFIMGGAFELLAALMIWRAISKADA